MKKASVLIKELEEHQYKNRLQEIYVDTHVLDNQKERYIAALQNFISLYGDQDVTIFSAPGRSEIIGNHTDHQHGRVLAAAINLDIIGIVSKNEGSIKVLSDSYDIEAVNISDHEIKESEQETSSALIRGVVARFKELNYKVGGFKGYFTSDVLVGSGLSSSAAFEVLIGTILSGLYNNMKVDPVTIGQVGQYAENVYFGKPCGLMDQCASSVGSLIYMDFKNPQEPVVERIDVDFSQFKHSLCIVDTKGSHANLTGEYAAIPAEMKQIAKVFDKKFLQEIEPKEFYQNIAKVREECKNDRAVLRAIHFFEENERVVTGVKALKEGDFDEFKRVIKNSGNSSYKYLQNVYTNKDVINQSVPIALVMSELILQTHGICRIHGGGFAGTMQAFVEDDYVEIYKEKIEQVLGEGTCHVLKIRKYGGIQVL